VTALQQASQTAPVYLVTGDDELLVRRAAERLLAELHAAVDDLDVHHVEVGSVDRLPDLRTASLFGGTRCVVLRDASGLTGDLAKDVEAYLADPAPDVILVLVARGVGRIRSIAARAAEVGERIEVKQPAPWDTDRWHDLVRSELARADRQADPPAVVAILDRAGTDPGTIAARCAQVAAATAPGARVSVADVERVVEGHGNRGGFVVADAIAERNPREALTAVRGALEAGEEPLALLGAIAFRLRQLLQVRGGADAKTSGMSGGQYRRLQHIVRGFGPGELAWCHDRLAQADLDLKSSDLPPDLVLEVAVAELATSREVGPPWTPAR
jgi:DNA polymerase III subunit delta